ncbi:SDR family NAD(P)-dependent oxidoreductase [Streptomyces sp. NPDC051217]|uniref:SDR family NAD(P)-dependent oxidoreductase n=1 Tax=Streptomyces sp. NPDC051217 TaxID=3365644 RepID=UPI00379DDA1B
MTDLSGKVALVTGASKGIGVAIAKHLAACGAAVAVNYATSREGAERVVEEITGSGSQAVAVQADVSKEAEVDLMFKQVTASLGRVDIVINNAGRFLMGSLDSISEDAYRHNFDTNVLGLLLVAKAGVEQFGPEGGVIVNIASAITRAPKPSGLGYGASKAAADYITKALAIELGPRKIRVNSVVPGMVDTEGAHAVGAFAQEAVDATVARTPLGRPGQPTDIAPVVAFLSSDDAQWVTGELVGATGGLY